MQAVEHANDREDPDRIEDSEVHRVSGKGNEIDEIQFENGHGIGNTASLSTVKM